MGVRLRIQDAFSILQKRLVRCPARPRLLHEMWPWPTPFDCPPAWLVDRKHNRLCYLDLAMQKTPDGTLGASSAARAALSSSMATERTDTAPFGEFTRWRHVVR